PNGAGKSTSMKVITGYYPPTAGSVTIDGLSVVDDSIKTREKIGYLPESNPLYMDLTVYEYLSMIAELRQIPSSERKPRIKKMCEITGITDRLGQVIGQLSKGYKQRVGLAQAMLHEPEILILDEPTIGLDPNQIVEIRSLIKQIGKERTVILSTHILPEVQATCDRVIIINRGKLVADGTPEQLQRKFEGQPIIDLQLKGEGVKDSAAFKSIAGIERVKERGNPATGVASLRLEIKKGSDPREEIFNLAVKNNWVLLEMSREIQSLENIFHQLTQTDPSAAKESVA
ncbi:ABC transporter ATP-binding protein, partial [bacterium]|nr:ABC transporter ATP-binding protein [bacterium]